MIKKSFLLLSCYVFTLFTGLKAEEGMWLPMLISQNIKEMQQMGLKLSAEDLYSVNNTSLKDGIVWFGGGCTGVIVSEEGLLLTNHHCGYGSIQSHSSVENDYLMDGFWAMSREEELPNPNLSVSFLRRMDDVSSRVLTGIGASMTEAQRDEVIDANIKAIEKEASENGKYEASVKPLYYGAEYYLYVYEVFKDVRLVGAPPSAIGKFGGDTDNWMWPRHTGDFSVFRIYSNKNNEPADFSSENVPYKPKYHFPVSIKPLKENDFTFVYGFPGRTNQYLTSYAVEQITSIENPIAISLRAKRLEIIDNAMKKDVAVRIQYSAKHASIANGWKKWIGENRGLAQMGAVDVKRNLENNFQKWAKGNSELDSRFGNLMHEFESVYASRLPFSVAYKYYFESVRAVEVFNFAQRFTYLVMQSQKPDKAAEEISELAKKMIPMVEDFFKNYYQPIDKEIFVNVFPAYLKNVDPAFHPESISMLNTEYNGDFNKYADYLYGNSIFVSKASVLNMLENYSPSDFSKIEGDPVYKLVSGFREMIETSVDKPLSAYNSKLDSLYRIYVEGLRLMEPQKNFFPDANSTLRITYGKIEGSFPRDATKYYHQTTAEGILEKASQVDTYEDYAIPERLEKLIQSKDFGRYGINNTLPVAFLASNHTTGGNSGSPVFNGKGELIGLNFDRSWESTMSDIMFDPEQCRNISVDMRYVLWVIDKYAGAGHLLKEMKVKK